MNASTSTSPAVSLLMAAYNAEESIGKAVESVMAQTFTDWELIVIDDGSTDRTAEITDRYSHSDHRIRVIHQENNGVSAVRRRALEEAEGEYVIYIDADDYIDPEMVEIMLGEAQARTLDITIADFVLEYPDGRTIYKKQYLDSPDSRIMQRALIDGSLHGSLCNKLIRRDIFMQKGLKFRSKLSFGEDMVEVLNLIRNGAKTGFIPQAFYHYSYFNNESLTNRGNKADYERRKEWIATLEKMTGNEFDTEIGMRKYSTLFFGLSRGLIDKKEFRSYGKKKWGYMRGIKGDRRYLPGMVLACMGLFSAGKLWCKLVRR